MKITDYIVPIILAYLTVWGVQYYFGWGYQKENCSEKTEQHFIAPVEQKGYKLLKKDIDFYDKQLRIRPKTTTIATTWGEVEISTFGATIESIEFLHSQCPIRTIFPLPYEDNSERALLVALDEQTPAAYTLVSQEESDLYTTLVYQTKTPLVAIRKEFKVYNAEYKIDMMLDITPETDQALDFVRIVWPSPIMSEGVAYNVTSGIAINNKDTFEKKAITSLNGQQGWFAPKFFGTDNKYFVHALVHYSNDAIVRAYYKIGDNNQLQSIVELPTIDTKKSFEYSFYFGPKELNAMDVVDPRLEQTLDFSGIFSPIAKLLLKLLKWLNDYLKNFGLAIIALTILMRLFMLPITMRGEKAAQEFKKKSSSMNAKINYLKQKYKDNPERLQQEQAELIKEQGISGMGGCLLPMLVQIPMFFALRNVLNSSLEMYQSSFLWISDLSASDPYYVLSLLVGITMAAQLMQSPTQKQQMNSIVMAVVFAAISTSFSAGLSLYFVINTVLGLMQSYAVKAFSK